MTKTMIAWGSIIIYPVLEFPKIKLVDSNIKKKEKKESMSFFS